jgi:hypothetical protein
VVEAEYIEASPPGVAPRVDMVPRVHQKPGRTVGDIARANGFDDRSAAPEEQPAALHRRRLPRMSDHVVEN